ncbi:MAG: hypothetical protein R6U89_05600 [Dehalococcoidia bacterium]
MKQYEAVIKVMEENGGFATLGYLYQNVLKVPGCEWETKTPFASIRRIVQDQRYFFKIKPGLWALNSYKDEVAIKFPIDEKSSKEEKAIFDHTYYQGLLVQIGNLKDYDTYVPGQDKNRYFLDKPLGDYAKINKLYEFTYPTILNRAKTVDVIWFNDRKLPNSFFEVEHSTDFKNSLLKFLELQDFHSRFVIVADENRHSEYEQKLSLVAFAELKERIKFLSYEALATHHANAVEYYGSRSTLQF